jgi:hypothetical protein
MLGLPIFLTFFAFWAVSTALVARTFAEVVITTVLPKTPLEVVISTMLITAFIFVMHDEEVIARVFYCDVFVAKRTTGQYTSVVQWELDRIAQRHLLHDQFLSRLRAYDDVLR